MNLDTSLIKDKNFSEPMVLFPLSQYQKLMEYIEDIEDRMCINESENEPVSDYLRNNKLFVLFKVNTWLNP